MPKFNVYLDNKLIDSVFYQMNGTIKESIETVRNSLINHDGYDPSIKVTFAKGQRVTEDEYNIQAYYFGQWETVNCETSWRAARASVKEYRDNEGGQYRIIKKRVKIDE